MTEIQPSNTDAILGGQNRLTTDTVVLGGIEGIEQRLTSQDKEIQKSALRVALKYEDKGLELLIDVWKNDSYKLKWQAFSLLITREEERVKHALSKYNPWLNMSCIHSWEQDSIAKSIAISPDGNTLFSGNEQQINVWNMQTKQQKSISFPYENARNLAITADGKTLISRGGDTSIISRDGENYLLLNKDNEALLRSLPGETIYHKSDRGIMLWQIETGEYSRIVEEFCPWRASPLVISPCEKFVIYGNEDRAIRVWNLKKGNLTKNISNSKCFISALAISNDGKILAAGTGGKVKIWDFKTRNILMVFHQKDAVRSVAISADKQTVVSGSQDKTVKVWDLQANTIKFNLKGHKGWVFCVAISPDGNYIFSCSCDKTIRVWDLHTGECVNILTDHTGLIYCLVVSSDGKTLISSSQDRTIKVWQRQF